MNGLRKPGIDDGEIEFYFNRLHQLANGCNARLKNSLNDPGS
jgi:hypothetical protein